MGKTGSFNNVTAEYVPIFFGLGIGLLLALASITEFVLPLDSLKKISGTVSRVEYNTFEYRSIRGLSGTYKNVSVWLKGKQSSFGITGMDIDTKDIESIAIGDEIDLYTKHGYQLPFFNSANEIYHLKKGQSVLLDIYSLRSGNRILLICSSILMIALSLILVKYSSDKDYR